AVVYCLYRLMLQTLSALKSVGLGSKVGFAEACLALMLYDKRWKLYLERLCPKPVGGSYS
ncbi:MAG TPA: hypothetical protein V6C50_04920, partial [Crinalium sp.]